MSEANNTPDPTRGPMDRPHGEGVPAVDGGLRPPGRGDVVDPEPQGDGDKGGDAPATPPA